MTENNTLAAIIESMNNRFTSGNEHPVRSARITRDEWEAIQMEMASLRAAAEMLALKEQYGFMPTHEHYKGDKYQFITIGRHESTLESQVAYKGSDGRVWFRPTEEFSDKFTSICNTNHSKQSKIPSIPDLVRKTFDAAHQFHLVLNELGGLRADLARFYEKKSAVPGVPGELFLVSKGGVEWNDPVCIALSEQDAKIKCECLAKTLDPNSPIDGLSAYVVTRLPVLNPGASDQSQVAQKMVLMPAELTAENGGKGLLIGEFSEKHTQLCSECLDGACADANAGDAGDCGNKAVCARCDGTGYMNVYVQVSWTTIKAIHRKAVAGLGVLIND